MLSDIFVHIKWMTDNNSTCLIFLAIHCFFFFFCYFVYNFDVVHITLSPFFSLFRTSVQWYMNGMNMVVCGVIKCLMTCCSTRTLWIMFTKNWLKKKCWNVFNWIVMQSCSVKGLCMCVWLSLYWVRHLTLFFSFQLLLISRMITLSSYQIWQIMSLNLLLNEYSRVYA